MRFVKNWSLKYKLMTLLVGLTCSMLMVYGALALNDFKNDKIAYVLDTSLAHSRTVALQIKTELDHLNNQVQFLTRGYNYKTKQFHPYTQSIFFNDRSIEGLYGVHFDADTKNYKVYAQLQKPIQDANLRNQIDKELNGVTLQAIGSEIVIRPLANTNYWLLGLKFIAPEQDKPIIFISLHKNGKFIDFFRAYQTQDTYLVNSKGLIALKPEKETYTLPAEHVSQAIESALHSFKAPEGTREFTPAQGDDLIVSYAKVGVADLYAISLLPRAVALEAVRNLIIKSVIFLMLLVFTTILASIFSSFSLTLSLKKLMQVTQDISLGNFKSTAQVESQDEVGQLSQSINTMAADIQRLLLESAEKSRMESELKTAQLVQATLFPKEDLLSPSIEIRGFYQPASECSGDWWFYKTIETKTYFYIGDATGHGVPAALLTCAARSAASTVDILPDMPLDKIMHVFNQAIYNTAQGRLMMTFFVGCYDSTTNQLSYCNASHEPPYLLKKLDRPLKRGDLEPLVNAVGPRLGESLNSKYQVASAQLNPGDRIVLYTDGVTELKNSTGGILGERKFISLLLENTNNGVGISDTIVSINNQIQDFRKNHPLEDDVTYFMIERPKAS